VRATRDRSHNAHDSRADAGIYTADAHRRADTTDHPGSYFGGLSSVYLQQQFRAVPALAGVSGSGCGTSAPLLEGWRRIRQIQGRRDSFSGEMTVFFMSMLRRRRTGHQKKEVAKLQGVLSRTSHASTSSRFPFTLLIGLARPLRETLHAPIACTLQGEDLFSRQTSPSRIDRRRWTLIRQQIRDVDLFIAVSH
jgi:hypothetical protein